LFGRDDHQARSHTNTRRWVYCLPNYTTTDNNATEKDDLTTKDTPPPSSLSSGVELTAETTAGNGEEVSQQLVNTDSTVIQHPLDVDNKENDSIVDSLKDVENQPVIQHTAKDEGERGGVQQAQSESILQTEPAINSSTTCSTILETSSPTNSFNQTLQQLLGLNEIKIALAQQGQLGQVKKASA
jgi:hypothetical protein